MNVNYVLSFLLISLVLFTSCEVNANDENNSFSNETEVELFTIKSLGIFDEGFCSKNDLKDKVIMIESKYCGHCQKTKPEFLEACHEKGITPLMLDLSVEKDRELMESYSLQALYTPTFIFGCNYYIGAMNKENYLELLTIFEGDKNE